MNLENSDESILEIIIEAGFNVEPSAVEHLNKFCNSAEGIRNLINNLKSNKHGSCVLTLEDIEKNINLLENEASVAIRNIADEAVISGDVNGFVEYFKSRYEKACKAFRERIQFRNFLNIESIKKLGARSEAITLGIVNKISRTKRGNMRIEIEDPSGVLNVIVPNNNLILIKECEKIILDEIIGVSGFYLGREKDMFIANEIYNVDIPFERINMKSSESSAIALISDLHIGSKNFMKKEFLRFILWLKGKLGNEKQKKLAEKVKYVIIAGDIVDGVGVYPEQSRDLEIKDIYEQYKKVYEYLCMFPEDLQIIIAPGNHDATRQAEPQPAIFEDYAEELYRDKRIKMVSNPSYIRINGLKILVYHGRSLDDAIARIPGLSYVNPCEAMEEILKKRTLVPIFGEKVPIAPHCNDCFFIEEVPDILHFGHVHVTQVKRYRWVNLVNSGAFQKQTDYQRRLNMQPDPGKVAIYDMEGNRITIMSFV